MRRRHFTASFSYTAAFLLAACSADSGSHSTVIIDPDGISAVVSGTQPRRFQDPLPVLRTEDEVIIGRGDGPREDLLPQAPPGTQTI